jgi:hypothetical protein
MSFGSCKPQSVDWALWPGLRRAKVCASSYANELLPAGIIADGPRSSAGICQRARQGLFNALDAKAATTLFQVQAQV